MTLVHQVLEPLIEHHVAAPALVKLMAMSADQAPKSRMTMLTFQLHGLGKLPVEVNPDSQVGIGNANAVFVEEVGQRQGDRIPAALDDLEVQISISCDPGPIVSVEAIEIGDESLQAKVIRLVQGHQADKTLRLYNRLRYQHILLKHRSNIA